MTPSGIAKLLPEDRSESLIVYLDIDEETRRSRLLGRRDADSVERRLKADDEDFENFNDFDHRIVDPEFSIGEEWASVENYKTEQLQ